MGNPTRGKGLRKGPDMQRQDQASGVPPDFLEHLPPKPESACLTTLCFSLTLLTLTGAIPDHLSLEKVNLELRLTVSCM